MRILNLLGICLMFKSLSRLLGNPLFLVGLGLGLGGRLFVGGVGKLVLKVMPRRAGDMLKRHGESVRDGFQPTLQQDLDLSIPGCNPVKTEKSRRDTRKLNQPCRAHSQQ